MTKSYQPPSGAGKPPSARRQTPRHQAREEPATCAPSTATPAQQACLEEARELQRAAEALAARVSRLGPPLWTPRHAMLSFLGEGIREALRLYQRAEAEGGELTLEGWRDVVEADATPRLVLRRGAGR